MKKRKILTFIIIITLSSWIYINTFSYNEDNNIRNENIINNKPRDNFELEIKKKTKKLNKNYEKKQLKKEIKRREKYHVNLLNYYNINFNENYLNLITDNSRILSSLRQKYYNEYLNI